MVSWERGLRCFSHRLSVWLVFLFDAFRCNSIAINAFFKETFKKLHKMQAQPTLFYNFTTRPPKIHTLTTPLRLKKTYLKFILIKKKKNYFFLNLNYVEWVRLDMGFEAYFLFYLLIGRVCEFHYNFSIRFLKSYIKLNISSSGPQKYWFVFQFLAMGYFNFRKMCN